MYNKILKTDHIFLPITLIALLANTPIQIQATCSKPATTYVIRSQTAYSSLYQKNLYNPFYSNNLTNNHDNNHEINTPTPWGSFTLTGAYNRSFNANALADNFFSTSDCPKGHSQLSIAGSRVPNRPPNAFLADYFMLPNDFESTLSFHPVIDSFVVDFNWFINLDRWINGAYFSFHVPIVHARTDMGISEWDKTEGVNPLPEGIFTPAAYDRKELLADFTEYLSGKLVKPAVQTVTDIKFLTIFQQLKNAKIDPCPQKNSGIAEIRSIAGWNFIRDRYHLGFNLQAIVPAGNKIKNQFLGEATIGNGYHLECGGALNGHYDLWQNNSQNTIITLYGQALLTHLFNSAQRRTFDLKNSPFSRYMLAEQMNTPRATPAELATPLKNNLLADGKKPLAQFTQQFAPVANLTTFNVDVSASIQADIVVALHLAYRDFHFDLGYNLWARSADSVRIRDAQATCNGDVWALKGDAQLFGFAENSTTNPQAKFPLVAGQPVPLSATQSKATIYNGTNIPATGAADQALFDLSRQNLTIDHPALATAGDTDSPTLLLTLPTAGSESKQINTSLDPIFISYKKEVDLSMDHAKGGMTSSLFAHFQYMGPECRSANTCRILPHIGIGGQIEHSHSIHALSQWHAWVTIGFDFR